MIKKLKITKEEKTRILNQHLVKEGGSLSKITGYVRYQLEPVPFTKVTLRKDDNIVKGVITDENGYFEMSDVPLGEYKIFISNKNEDYEDSEGESVKIDTAKTYELKLYFSKTQNIEDVTVVSKNVSGTIVDVLVVDDLGQPIKGATVNLFYGRTPIEITQPNVTNENGKVNNIMIDKAKYSDFNTENKERCVEKRDIKVLVTYGELKMENSFPVCLINGSINTETKVIQRFSKNSDSNKITFELKTKIPYIVEVFNENNRKLDNSNIKVYSKDKETLISSGKGSVRSSYDISKTKNTKVNVVVTSEGYKSFDGDYKLKTDGENNIIIKLEVIEPPKVPTDLTEGKCRRATRRFYRDMQKVDGKFTTIDELGGNDTIIKRRTMVQDCFIKFKGSYSDRLKKIVRRLINVQGDLNIFGLRFTLSQQRDIYKENTDMLINTTIRKVVSEHIEKKQIISQEKNLIKKRYEFVLEGLSNKKPSLIESKLRQERKELLGGGYDKKIVNETFLDIMNTIYGTEGNNILTDVKKRLGERIASQVKNREDEHEMILSAFEEIPEEVVERAIKENRVDELSGMIATKAMTGYREQFGSEGISGLMIASVDENKFKQEVAKLIEPAIKDITTKMDDKFKQVQDAVSGVGLNPTA